MIIIDVHVLHRRDAPVAVISSRPQQLDAIRLEECLFHFVKAQRKISGLVDSVRLRF